ncbi:hypothetical protein T459_27362 [Capsicum annuum]|uniref:Uncharacterized protein n=1 Tax=Capsicum annuum TaxID=4072 RepID=A0A2G2YDR1_CAPAN|nr:hypothetical protein T459_27362 [Capsicum annuum]
MDGVNKVGIVSSTVIESTPFCIFIVDSILLRIELFRKAPYPPAPAPDASSPTTDASSPTPMMSPLAPPTSSMAGDPEDGPATDSENSTMGKKKNYTEIMMEQINRMDEKIEMKNVENWSVVNIDNSDEKNEITVVEYIDDIYA